MYRQALSNRQKIFAVAPMIDWTDRHCRLFHRQLTRHALLYSEMIVGDALVRGDAARHLDFDAAEHPVALQLGGSNPAVLAQAARIGADFGYDEINLNVGCPSDRVQSGSFGACLMETPELVGDCVAAMKAAVSIPVTVKCRIGVDDQDTETALDALASAVVAAGADAIWVHARKAWLQGLSPKENREVPPLDYGRVFRLKQRIPNVFIGLNGGIANLNQALEVLNQVDGVMLGRAAYHTPDLLTDVDAMIYRETGSTVEISTVLDMMMEHARLHIAAGGRLGHVTRHMTGLFHGRKGARRWRQILSEDGARPGAGPEVIARAFQAVDAERLAA